MHRLRSKSAIHRFRLAAVLLCLKCALVPASIAFLGYTLVVYDTELILMALGLVLLVVLLTLLQWLVSTRTSCPLCMTPVLAKKRCAKHRRSRTFLGSHRLRVAFAVIFTNSFRCPYCHESTALEVRGRKYRY